MKTKRLLLLATSILAITTLGACRRGGRGSGSTTGGDNPSTQTTTGGHVIPSTGGTSAGGSSSSSSSTYSALSIMEDICTFAWGGVEDGDLADPDSDGVIQCNYVIQLDVEDTPTDSETYINGFLESFISEEGFPTYLAVVDGPTYTAQGLELSGGTKVGVSDIYLMTDDEAFVLYMYGYVADGDALIAFCAGPTSAFTE